MAFSPAASANLDEAFSIATEHGFELQLSSLMLDKGRLLVKRGHYGEGMALIRESFERLRDQDSLDSAWCRLNLAYACGKAGRMQEAFALISEVEELKNESGVGASELHWFKGELLARTPGRAREAEQSFRTVIERARETAAKASELRATLSLARLLRETGRRDEARAMLAEIYGWFTEGFDTANLKDAKALLDELGGKGE